MARCCQSQYPEQSLECVKGWMLLRQQQRRYHQRNRWQQLLMTAVLTRWFPNTTWTCLAAAWLSSRYVSAMIRIMLSWSKPHPAWLEREQVLYIVWRALLDQEKCCGHVKTMTVNSSCFATHCACLVSYNPSCSCGSFERCLVTRKAKSCSYGIVQQSRGGLFVSFAYQGRVELILQRERSSK